MQNTDVIKPIQIGSIKLPSNVVQAPLAGYSCAPFRVLATRYGKPGFCSTEMISAHDLVHKKAQPKRYLYRDPEEGLLSYQLSGNNPEILARATEIVTKAGADLIDLNCGCPVDKIRRKGCGSKLLTTPEKLYQLLSAIKSYTHVPVSAKIRVATPINDHDEHALVDAISQAGAHFITVHGRHWTERYDVACQMDAIQRIVSFSKLPVFANGDVCDIQSMQSLFAKTNCAGVMIGRAGVGRPWIYQQLLAEQLQIPFQEPVHEQIAHMYIEHIERLILLENEKLAVLQARKLAKYYSAGIKNRPLFINDIQQAASFNQIKNITMQYFKSII